MPVSHEARGMAYAESRYGLSGSTGRDAADIREFPNPCPVRALFTIPEALRTVVKMVGLINGE